LRKLLIGLLALVCMTTFMEAQNNFGWQISKEFEATYQAPVDQVWNAVVKSLMQMKYRVTTSDRDGGIITATKKVGVMDGLNGQGSDDMPQWDLVIQEQTDGVHLLCQHTLGKGQLNIGKTAQKRFKKLAEKIAENLQEKT